MAALPDYFREAQKHHNAQRFVEAEALYGRVVDAEPSHLGAWHHLGLVCMVQKNLPDALRAFEKAPELAPDHVDTLTQVGVVMAKHSKLPDAVARFRRAIELRPQHAKAHGD